MDSVDMAVRGGLVPAGSSVDLVSSLAPSATFIGGGFRLSVRSPAMTNAYSPPPQPIRLHPANEPTPDPNAFVSLLHSIGAGAASNGRPWPEGHLPQGRRMALSGADCSLNGLRVVMEILLAAERPGSMESVTSMSATVCWSGRPDRQAAPINVTRHAQPRTVNSRALSSKPLNLHEASP